MQVPAGLCSASLDACLCFFHMSMVVLTLAHAPILRELSFPFFSGWSFFGNACHDASALLISFESLAGNPAAKTVHTRTPNSICRSCWGGAANNDEPCAHPKYTPYTFVSLRLSHSLSCLRTSASCSRPSSTISARASRGHRPKDPLEPPAKQEKRFKKRLLDRQLQLSL